MVNTFIVHSGTDYDYVKNFVEPYLMGQVDEEGKEANKENNANILTLKSGIKKQWKWDALKKIKMAQVIIVILGKDSSVEEKIKTMGWEVKKATKLNKQILLLNPSKYEIPKYMFGKNRFTGQNEQVAKESTIKEIKERIDNFSKGYYNIFSTEYEKMDDTEKESHKEELIDQYKMFQKSSEDLVSRRQSVNSFYISVNSALVALMGVVLGLVDTPAKIYVILFMSITGIILDISWIHILEAYGTLNSAKMKVINLLEEKLPVALYDVEWRVMSDKLNNKKYVSFTNSEKRVPKIFSLVYIVIAILVIVYTIIIYL